MNTKMKLSAVAVLSVGALIAACGGDDTTETAASTTTTTTTTTTTAAGGAGGAGGSTTTSAAGGAGGMGPEYPAAPKLGLQIDRMGRPAINTVGSKTFNKALRDAAEDAYNADGMADGWAAKYTADIAGSLAVLDALDKPDNAMASMAGCGNQIAAGGKQTAGAYDFLAGVLANDRLWVKLTAKGGCGLYLAVEANALMVTNDLCGGRIPTDDVIDESYSILAGAFDFSKLPMNPFLFGDTIPVDPATKTAYEAGFPYFAAKK